jgi:hypothetical protein
VRTTHTWFTDTINTHIPETRLRNFIPRTSTASRRPLPSKKPRKRVPPKKGLLLVMRWFGQCLKSHSGVLEVTEFGLPQA